MFTLKLVNRIVPWRQLKRCEAWVGTIVPTHAVTTRHTRVKRWAADWLGICPLGWFVAEPASRDVALKATCSPDAGRGSGQWSRPTPRAELARRTVESHSLRAKPQKPFGASWTALTWCGFSIVGSTVHRNKTNVSSLHLPCTHGRASSF